MSSRVVAPFQFWSENPLFVDLASFDTTGNDNFDSIVLVVTELNQVPSTVPCLSKFYNILKAHKETDVAFEDSETFMALEDTPNENKLIRRLVYSPTGPINRDFDDVRRYADAAQRGIARILKSGAKQPLLVVLDSKNKFKYSELVTLLGAAETLYVPIEIREDVPNKSSKAVRIGFSATKSSHETIRLASAIEMGRIMCRDIAGSDPERMAAPNVALYVQELFANTCINVEVIENESVIEKEYPLLAAVNRAARGIKRHTARVIHLTYEPEGGQYNKTLALVGKGVTYDTGGADVKAGGHMAGMHRDKSGAAAVAGFFQTLAVLRPKGIKVLGSMAMVRNSIGSDSYVADEIITSRAGVRIRIGNTDAEGRMAMGDVLCHAKEKVIKEKNPHLFTIATLTGHACLTVGDGYSIVMENGPAKNDNIGPALKKAGEEIGDMFEISSIRREDYEFHKGKSEYEDLLQCNNCPSSQTARGHITPAAFLIVASGLDKHGSDSQQPLKYCHIDIAASSGPFPGIPSGAPIPALTNCFLIPK